MKTAGCLPQTRLNYALILGYLAALGPLCTDLYIASLPEITQVFATTPSATQLSLTSSLVGLGIGQLLFGPLSDRYGRRLPLMISLTLLVLSTLACCFAQSMEQLIIARLFQGLSGSGGVVISRSIARDRYQGHELTKFFALLMMINGIAPIVAPVAGAGLLTIMDWRGIFIVLMLISIVLLLFSHLQLQETLPKSDRSNSSLLISFQQMGKLITRKRFIGLCLTQGFVLAGMFAYIGASSFVLQEHYHLSAQLYSVCFAVNGCGLVVSAQMSAKLAIRFGEQKVMQAVLIFAVVAVSLLLVSSYLNASLWIFLPLLFCAVIVNSMIGTTSTALAMQEIAASGSGGASALLGSLMFILGGISAPISGLGGSSPAAMALTMAGCYFIAFILYTILVTWQLTNHRQTPLQNR
ncbi:multidrug effflux MFS transporter [Celerinatantimonas diazotrophica]|uniref:Bcr/CflA family efflux transporter n=1 Tax=Celerinatantimonas diazotrophica TaxID=412034 RepID=A0A4R1KAM3_9GAMM|nr:multidrug effflux MFS transporter [Celerinatantimonas diazotrophica]TCK61472.1 DHA1 family bicyclomycin/chloramphenicol resistance-like MFS transporter [Celerinatantimonas diazotrophica]CAG9296935.1 Bicyclomycin resistance protein [Celerinatantimonas diazotrophica]